MLRHGGLFVVSAREPIEKHSQPFTEPVPALFEGKSYLGALYKRKDRIAARLRTIKQPDRNLYPAGLFVVLLVCCTIAVQSDVVTILGVASQTYLITLSIGDGERKRFFCVDGFPI